MDVVFNSIKMKNFMSFGNLWTAVKLDDPGTTLIIGENLDDGASSGAGKTTLINAISFAAFDKIPSGVSKDRLINQTNDKKNTSMEVEFTFTTNGHIYQVIRKRGEQGGMQLLEDGKDMTPASSGAFNDKVEELLGVSFNLFSQIILFNGNSKPFLDFSVGDQRALIEELFRITILSRKANACKKRATQTDKDIGLQKLLITQQQKQNDNYHRHLSEARERAARWEAQRTVDIQKILNDITTLNNIDFETEESLHQEISRLSSVLSPIESQIRELTTKHTAKKNERYSKNTDIALLESGIAKKEQDLKKIKSELDHLADAKCPYCLQKYVDTKAKIDELTVKVQKLDSDLVTDRETLEVLKAAALEFNERVKLESFTLFNEIDEKKSTTVDLTSELSEIKAVILYKSEKDLISAKNSLSVLQDKVTNLSASSNPHTESITALEKEGEVTVDHDRLEELLLLQEHQQFLIKLLMDKNSFIRKNIISKTLPFLNKRIGYYTQSLNLPHLTIFQSDMSCEITQYGRKLDHGNLSNGEKKKLNLSICLAFRDVLTFNHAKFNVLFTDEIDGGSISGPDVDSLITLIKHKAWDDGLGIYIISHRPEFDGRCDRNLVVRKERGFSNIITQPDE